ncbi:hypothetical protein STEG23_017013, partial [Scotinomys teguina]
MCPVAYQVYFHYLYDLNLTLTATTLGSCSKIPSDFYHSMQTWFCLDYLSVGECGTLKLLTINIYSHFGLKPKQVAALKFPRISTLLCSGNP